MNQKAYEIFEECVREKLAGKYWCMASGARLEILPELGFDRDKPFRVRDESTNKVKDVSIGDLDYMERRE